MSKRDANLYIEDILTAIERISKHVEGLSAQEFSNQEIVIDAVVRNIEVIGEAARNMPEDVKNANTNIPWDKMVAMRNKVIHEYFGIDTEILWKTIKENLPALYKQVKVLEQYKN